MTREERVDWLCRLRCWVVAPSLMTAEQKSKFIEALTETINALRTEPCEDAISRAEAMNVLDALYLDGESAQGFTADANEDCLIGKYKAIELLDELPSVQPEPKTGRWEYVQYDGNPKIGNWHCSECNRLVYGVISARNPVYAYNYCPECGAKMESEDEE